MGQTDKRGQGEHVVVAVANTPEQMGPCATASTFDNHSHRRFDSWLGSVVRRLDFERIVGPEGQSMPHQHPRNESGRIDLTDACDSAERCSRMFQN